MNEIRRIWAVPSLMMAAFLVLMLVLRTFGAPLPLPEVPNAWATITLAIIIQALPFLLLGTLLSGVISAFIPTSWFSQITPRSKLLAVPAAGVAGMVLPGCECASVPVSQSLIRRGLPTSAAFTFMLAAPAVNPVVLVATAVAFNAQPMMVWARFTASLAAVMIIGWTWVMWGKDSWLKQQSSHCHTESKATVFRQTVQHDMLQAGGFLVVGAMAAGLMKVLVPKNVLLALTANPLLAVLVMALVAIILSLCSEADAFVAVSFTAFSPTAQLAFLVVGPMIDIKLFAMQWGAFGPGFVARFVPVTLVACIASALVVGTLFFGGL